MPLTVRVTRNDFAKIAHGLEPKLATIVTATTLEIAAHAKEIVPVKTHNLQRSIHTEHPERLRGLAGTDVEYARFVEYGTVNMAAQPYLTPAVEAARAKFVGRVRRVFDHG